MGFVYNNNLFYVDYSTLTALLLPALLRENAQLQWNYALAAPVQNDNILFTQYLTGSTYPIFSATTSYTDGERVIYVDDGIYENLTGSTGVIPGVASASTTWLEVNPSFIGAEERSAYNSQKITLEYALNRDYQVLPIISNQLVWTGANHINQIYINNNDVVNPGFVMGNTGIWSSTMSRTGQMEIINKGQWMGYYYSASSQYDFTVWVPNLTLYTGITNTSVSAYTQDFVLSGIEFNVESY